MAELARFWRTPYSSRANCWAEAGTDRNATARKRRLAAGREGRGRRESAKGKMMLYLRWRRLVGIRCKKQSLADLGLTARPRTSNPTLSYRPFYGRALTSKA